MNGNCQFCGVKAGHKRLVCKARFEQLAEKLKEAEAKQIGNEYCNNRIAELEAENAALRRMAQALETHHQLIDLTRDESCSDCEMTNAEIQQALVRGV